MLPLILTQELLFLLKPSPHLPVSLCNMVRHRSDSERDGVDSCRTPCALGHWGQALCRACIVDGLLGSGL